MKTPLFIQELTKKIEQAGFENEAAANSWLAANLKSLSATAKAT